MVIFCFPIIRTLRGSVFINTIGHTIISFPDSFSWDRGRLCRPVLSLVSRVRRKPKTFLTRFREYKRLNSKDYPDQSYGNQKPSQKSPRDELPHKYTMHSPNHDIIPINSESCCPVPKCHVH